MFKIILLWTITIFSHAHTCEKCYDYFDKLSNMHEYDTIYLEDDYAKGYMEGMINAMSFCRDICKINHSDD